MAALSSLSYSVVVPTIGRPSLRTLLRTLLNSLAAAAGADGPRAIIVVDDRPEPGAPLPLPPEVDERVEVLRSGGRGPAAARNAGWRAATTEWVVFLDDDVVIAQGWAAELAADLAAVPAGAGGSQGRLTVPLPAGRRPTDWERNTAGLERASWITADMAYRRAVLAECGGFDERYGRAYREDADLALRAMDAGHRLVRGTRRVTHPVRPAGFWASVRAQAGNADDVLMKRVHGRDWRARAGEGRGRFRRHLLTTTAGTTALAALALLTTRTARPTPLTERAGIAASLGLRARTHTPAPAGTAASLGRWARTHAPGPAGTAASFGRRAWGRSPGLAGIAAAAGLVWVGMTAEFAAARIRPGPRSPGEIARMLVTSVAIPPAAVRHRVRGLIRHRKAAPWPRRRVVLFDRDDTLIHDVPYNGDPAHVEPMPGAADALERLRRHGVRIGVVSNQSGVGKGYITARDVLRVNARVEELLGRIDVWEICPHDHAAGCSCRKPRPGLVERAAERLGAHPSDCVVIGDIGRDVEAAAAAGARGILVPTARTRLEEIARAREVAPDLRSAVDLVLGEEHGR
ncbi:HAD-IIIA family hydrolase [Spirillospora sp. NPDC029432]|uniref:HAD-IIIA family hydrolase n=1 Tax=Spirillospora sp. NPDC029432 TaxID=3154599 RepID=UPI0034543493